MDEDRDGVKHWIQAKYVKIDHTGDKAEARDDRLEAIQQADKDTKARNKSESEQRRLKVEAEWLESVDKEGGEFHRSARQSEGEYDQLSDEVARIASETEFSGLQLTDGTLTQISVQVGIDNNTSSRISFELGELTTTVLGLGTAVTLTSATGARSALETIDAALDSVNGYRAEFGAVQNRLESAFSNSQSFQQALTAAASTIQDADFAEETSSMTRHQIMQQAGQAAMIQAKLMHQSVIALLF